MTRKEMYDAIKEHKLESVIKNKTGRNYTNCSNDVLDYYIDHLIMKVTKYKKPIQVSPISLKNIKIDRLIEVLEKKHILLKSEIDYINK